jgi:hypothetical protein
MMFINPDLNLITSPVRLKKGIGGKNILKKALIISNL